MKEPQYKVRPSSLADPKDFFRIFLSPAQLLLHKFHPGNVCHIVTLDKSLTQPAIVWPATEKIKDDVVQTSKALQILYGLKLDSRISIRRGNIDPTEAHKIVLREIPKDVSESALPDLDEIGRCHWAWLLKHQLVKAEVLAPGMTFDRVEANDEIRSFRIQSINSSVDTILYRAQPDCTVCLEDSDHESAVKSLVVSGQGIGGLDKQINSLNAIISPYGDPSAADKELPLPFQRLRRNGILLHGPSGTGKSKLLETICAAGWRKVFRINTGEYAAIHQIFSDALRYQPSAIIIDNLEWYAGRKDLGRPGNILSEELRRLDGARTLAIGATRSLHRVDQDLRRLWCFALEIEIPFPDSKSRAEILKILSKLPKDEPHSTLDALAARTNGFSGENLFDMLDQAWHIKRSESEHGDSADTQDLLMVMEDAFSRAIRAIRPKTLQLEIPETKFGDIGGQHEVKKRIQQALLWPIKYPDKMKQCGLKPKKGLLLYGPPGCSKTMTARAVATESGLNFLVVKGAELLNMYVGETELAVRELFAKASAASPSVIFFDEFDALGTARAGSEQGGVHVLTTLLNELDGVQYLEGVFVLAATNRPDLLDSALLRAGRLSEALYVGLPDLEARRHILQMQGPLQLSDDVDIVALSQMTEGYTGAEIVQICQNAAYMALDQHKESNERVTVSQQHVITALASASKCVTPQMLSRYEAWGAGLGLRPRY